MANRPTPAELKARADLILAKDKIKKLRSFLGKVGKSGKTKKQKRQEADKLMKETK